MTFKAETANKFTCAFWERYVLITEEWEIDWGGGSRERDQDPDAQQDCFLHFSHVNVQ